MDKPKEQYIADVWARLSRVYEVKDPTDIEEARKTIGTCYEYRFTEDDAFRYTRLTEHVNPDIPEDVACSRMGIIVAKYAKNAGHWAGFPEKKED